MWHYFIFICENVTLRARFCFHVFKFQPTCGDKQIVHKDQSKSRDNTSVSSFTCGEANNLSENVCFTCGIIHLLCYVNIFVHM